MCSDRCICSEHSTVYTLGQRHSEWSWVIANYLQYFVTYRQLSYCSL